MQTKTFVIDCEFNGPTRDLISMALVAVDDNTTLYAVTGPTPGKPIDGWVKDNVLPLIKNEIRITIPQFQRTLEKFLSGYAAIHIVADWPEDIMYFCQTMITGPGERINTPPLTFEVRRDLDAESKNPHHALADAEAIALLYRERVSVQQSNSFYREGIVAYHQGLGISHNPYITGPAIPESAKVWMQGYQDALKGEEKWTEIT